MFHAHDFSGVELAPMSCLRHGSGAWPLEVEEIGGSGFVGSSHAPLLAGERIVIDLPGIGEVEAKVRFAGRHGFTAEWSGSNALRLRFLAGWRRGGLRSAA